MLLVPGRSAQDSQVSTNVGQLVVAKGEWLRVQPRTDFNSIPSPVAAFPAFPSSRFRPSDPDTVRTACVLGISAAL